MLKLRLAAGLINDDAVLQQENALITAQEARRKSEEVLKDAKSDFCLGIEVPYCDSVTLTGDLEDIAPAAGGADYGKVLEAARAASSSYHSAQKAEALAKAKYDAMSDPLIATSSEKEAARKAWESAKSKLGTTARTLQTSVSDAVSQHGPWQTMTCRSFRARWPRPRWQRRDKVQIRRAVQYEMDAERSN